MSLSIGIVGMPNVGKSTLFNALTENSVLAANYPFATIEPNTGIVPIPDDRLSTLAELYKTDKVIPASIKFVDIAGLVRGAAEGQGLGNQFLAHIREADAVCHVVRAFGGEVVHVEHSVDPARDIGTIETELVLADLQTVAKHLPLLEKQAKSDPKLQPDVTHLKAVMAKLDEGVPLNKTDLTAEQKIGSLSRDYQTFVRQLITAKPVIYAFNLDEPDLADRSKQQTLHALVEPAPSLAINAELEARLISLAPDERRELLQMSGVEATGLERLAALSYHALGLQSFLTAGPKEVRAWTIPAGATAPEAAGVIHTDFQRGFIAAEVVSFDDLIESGSRQAAKAKGLVRTEGRSYVMQPDDIVEFRFNV
jgi:GTP-binding protein YchF